MSKIFLVKDEKVGFLNSVVDENVDIAKFNFGRGFYSSDSLLGRLEDYSLYECGDIDGDSVLFHEPIFIVNGLTAYTDFINRYNSLKSSVPELDNSNGA